MIASSINGKVSRFLCGRRIAFGIGISGQLEKNNKNWRLNHAATNKKVYFEILWRSMQRVDQV